MKYFIVAIVVAFLAVSVKAKSFEDQGGDSNDEDDQCRCRRNECTGITGLKVIRGCRNTNSYIQCNSATCSVAVCPTNEVWNKTSNQCATCATGMHISANGQVCACDQGTTFDFKTKACVACPTGATKTNDYCYCASPLVLNIQAKSCSSCPQGSTLKGRECNCGTGNSWWNEAQFQCQTCPGTYSLSIRGRKTCTCSATQIFDDDQVACVTCPDGSTAKNNEYCSCPIRGQTVNWKTQKCECERGRQLNANGDACVRAAITTATTAATPATP